MATIGLLALAAAIAPIPAVADTVFQIEAAWEDGTATSVRSGDVVTGVWRVNLNDDAPAPSNDPIDDVTVTIVTENARFTELPSLCLTAGVTPISSRSADGHTVVCNLGTRDEGTAVVIQAPVVADGPTGSAITATGTIDGQVATLDPIPITNAFGMDIRWASATSSVTSVTGGYVLDLQWTLSKALGSEAGPQSISYALDISSTSGILAVDAKGCTPFTLGAAVGHPWSGGAHQAGMMTVPASTCTVVQTGPTTFVLTITGIDYDPLTPPARESSVRTLPVDQVALASGEIWIRVTATGSGSVTLTSDAPTYTSVGAQTAQDDPSNNTVSKAWVPYGAYSSAWVRNYTKSGGTNWDDTYRVAPGTTVRQYLDTAMQMHTDRADDRRVGMCSALDTRYVTYAGWLWDSATYAVTGAVTEFYIGADPTLNPADPAYNPRAFDCGTATGWTTVEPADRSTVTAVRITGTQGQFEQLAGYEHVTAGVLMRVAPDTPVGTDIWSTASTILDISPTSDGWRQVANCVTATPGSRYPCTTGYFDVVRIVTATPAVTKTVDRSVVSPGQPAVFTIGYSANGAGAIPESVDGFLLVDTLPAGVEYVAGSASPEPTVTLVGSGRQVLTWTLDGVTTNADHALTYQAVVGSSATPGLALTNSVTASYGGVSVSATAQVTVAKNGATVLVKSADAPFIPNLLGDGVGEGSWTVSIRSYDPIVQSFTDTIDILPYLGDGRGSAFSGTYRLTSVSAEPGATVLYTTADPTTLSDDPSDPRNGTGPGDPTGNTVGWTTVQPERPTAVRVIGGELAPGQMRTFGVHIITDGVDEGDVLVNRAQSIAGHTALVMRDADVIEVAAHSSAALIKEVQASDGSWHGANDAIDYPVFHPGDTVAYRITVENTGQSTLTNVLVSDDRNPALGAFEIASLAPGERASHEYEVALGDDVPAGPLVNTACASADIPDDSEIAPDIPCDPAGIEVVDFLVQKTSDPVSGSDVVSGETIVYTVRVTQLGSTPSEAALSDDLSPVLDDAVYNGDVTADLGTVTVTGERLEWSGTLLVGAVATITYSVTVTGDGDDSLVNAVTSPGCVRLADCTTNHHVVVPGLAFTGSTLGLGIGGLALVLLIGGGMIALIRRRHGARG